MGAGKGAIIGAVIGGIFGGYAGAIIGAFIGGGIGGAAEDIYTTASTPPPPPPPPNSEPPAQLLAFFRLAGHLAKIDGRVSVAEANFISALIRKIGADDQALRTACKQAFDQGKTYADFDVDLYLLGAGEYLLRHQALEALCALARIDDVITDAERQFLLDAERIWNLAGSVDYFSATLKSNKSGKNAVRRPRRRIPSPKPTLRWAVRRRIATPQ